jgi:hypothetical protein
LQHDLDDPDFSTEGGQYRSMTSPSSAPAPSFCLTQLSAGVPRLGRARLSLRMCHRTRSWAEFPRIS